MFLPQIGICSQPLFYNIGEEEMDNLGGVGTEVAADQNAGAGGAGGEGAGAGAGTGAGDGTGTGAGEGAGAGEGEGTGSARSQDGRADPQGYRRTKKAPSGTRQEMGQRSFPQKSLRRGISRRRQ